jgi:hypothetical protein
MIARWIPSRVLPALLVALLAATKVGAQDGGPKKWTVDDLMALKGVGDIAVPD